MIKKYTIFLLASVWMSANLQAQSTTADGLPASPLQRFAMQVAMEKCPDLAALRSRAVSAALLAFYERSNYAPYWQDARRLDALQKQLAELHDDGLIVADYRAALNASVNSDMCQEIRLSSYYLLALEHLSLGRLPQQELEPQWQSATTGPTEGLDLIELATHGRQDMATAFDQARPRLALYRELRRAYAQMDKEPPSRPAISPGTTLKPGMMDSRVDELEARLRADGYLDQTATRSISASESSSAMPTQLYDQRLQEAVRQFQQDVGLEADGIVGPQTLTALNFTPAHRLLQARINLERLRWLNAQRDDYLLLTNVAGGNIRLYRDDTIIWQARTQSGRPARPTPALISNVSRITVNPSWTVPPTILLQDALPQIRRSLDYLEEHNMQVLDSRGDPVDPREVNWNQPNGLILRQAPGPTNPLGQLAFRFDNPFSIYLHDTPRKDLFGAAGRNFSSGCVRVEDAEGLAGHLLAGMTSSQRDQIEALQDSGKTHEVNLSGGPQLILGYWTAEGDRDGRLLFMQDPYGLDQALIDAFISLDSPAEENDRQPGR